MEDVRILLEYWLHAARERDVWRNVLLEAGFRNSFSSTNDDDYDDNDDTVNQACITS